MQELLADARVYGLVVADDTLFYRVAQTRFPGQADAYFQHDFLRSHEVSEHVYNRAKYRGALAPSHDGEAITFLPNGDSLRCFWSDSIVRHFDSLGQLVRELPASIEATMGIESITVDADGQLWTAEPAFHHVAQYDLASARKLYAVGGSWEPGELSYPEEVICYEQHLFISDMGHQRLAQLNPRTKRLHTYRTFTQRVWEYRRVKNHEVVRLQDGLYIL